jgi:hypothetical protein
MITPTLLLLSSKGAPYEIGLSDLLFGAKNRSHYLLIWIHIKTIQPSAGRMVYRSGEKKHEIL